MTEEQQIPSASSDRDTQALQKYVRTLLDWGLVSEATTPEGTRYEITETGSEFLRELEELASGTSERLLELDQIPFGLSTSQGLTITPKSLDVVVVIPALNEAEGIATTIEDCQIALRDSLFEILVIDGRSSDGTDRIALSKGARVIHQRRRGYGDALQTGFLYATQKMNAKAIVMIDADSTYDPLDVPSLLQPILADQADMVIGNRLQGMTNGAMTMTNRVGNRLLSWVARVTLNISLRDTQCGLRAFRTELIDCMDFDADGMPFAIEMIANAVAARARIAEVPVGYRPRTGKTKLSPLKDGFRILGTMIRLVRDARPLLFFGLSGLILGVTGLAFGLDVTLEWFKTGTIRRLPTVMLAALLIIGSMQFLTLGLVADMIKRSFRRRNHVQR